MAAAAPATKPAEAPKLSKMQKLAILLIILGPDAAAQVLRSFGPHEVEAISAEMSKFPMVSQELQTEVLQDFSEVAIQAGTAIRGGLDVTRTTLEKALGLFKASEIVGRLAPTTSSIGAVKAIVEMDSRQLYSLLRDEQAQTIALVLSYAGPEKAAETLTFFQQDQHDKIIERIATLAPTPVEVVEKVVEVLVARRGVSPTRALSLMGGVKTAADLLNAMDKNAGRMLLTTLEERNPDLGQAIRQKMFTFEDLAKLDTSILQRILREVDVRELALALKNASDKLKNSLLSCITRRAAETVQEEMLFMGAVRLRDIEAAQLRVIDSVRRLEAEGAIDLGNETQEAKYEVV